MTTREFFSAVSSMTEATDEVKAYAVDALEKLDAKAQADAEKRAEKRAADKPIVDGIDQALVGSSLEKPVTAAELALTFDGAVSVPKITAVIRTQMTDRVKSTEVKRDKRIVKGYYIG